METSKDNERNEETNTSELRGRGDGAFCSGSRTQDQSCSGHTPRPVRIVVDTNRLIAAILKDGTTKEIFKNASFFVPEHVLVELKRHRTELVRRTTLSLVDFERREKEVRRATRKVSESVYRKYLSIAQVVLTKDDAAVLACCIAINADAIWTHDAHFFKTGKMVTNNDLLHMIKKRVKIG